MSNFIKKVTGTEKKIFPQYLLQSLFILVVIALIYCAFFTQPLIDEYAFINFNREGFVHGFLIAYNNWMSRYTGIIILLTSTLNYSTNLFFIYPIITIIVVFLSIYLFLKNYIKKNALFYSMMINLIFILFCPSLVESFFWLASTAMYTIPTCFILFYFIAFKNKQYFLLFFLQILILGGIEINIPIMLFINLYFLYDKKYRKLSIIMLILYFINIMFLFLNSGNNIRTVQIENSFSSKIPSILDMLYMTIWKSISIVIKFNFIPFIFFLAINFLYPVTLKSGKIKKQIVIQLLIAYIVVISSPLFVAIYGLKNFPPPRVENSIVFLSLILLFFISKAIIDNARYTIKPMKCIYIIIFLAVIYLILPKYVYGQHYNNMYTIFNEISTGTLQKINLENKQRLNIVQNSGCTECLVPEKKYKSNIIAVENWLSTEQDSWSNKIYARYFRVKSVKTKN